MGSIFVLSIWRHRSGIEICKIPDVRIHAVKYLDEDVGNMGNVQMTDELEERCQVSHGWWLNDSRG